MTKPGMFSSGTITYRERDERAKAIQEATANLTRRLIQGAIAPDLANARLREYADMIGIIDTADDAIWWNYHPQITRPS